MESRRDRINGEARGRRAGAPDATRADVSAALNTPMGGGAAPGTITRLLNGEGCACDDGLYRLVYAELRAIAAHRLRREHVRAMETTVLVHEAWLKLAGCRWESRGHYFATAARAMRQVLVDDARRRRVRRARAGARTPTTVCAPCGLDPLDVLALDEALAVLERFDPRAAAIVNLRYFAGLEMAQLAEALGMKLRTAERDWAYARAWLLDRIEGGAEGPRRDSAHPSAARNGAADGERP